METTLKCDAIQFQYIAWPIVALVDIICNYELDKLLFVVST